MAVTGVSIYQDNKENNVDLMAACSHLIYLIDVEYTGEKPEILAVDVKDKDDNVLGTFQCLEYQDLIDVVRYRFIASDIIRAYMPQLDDYVSELNNLEYVGNNYVFTFEFYSGGFSASTTIDALFAAAQFGETPSLEGIYNNENLIFYGCIGEPMYVYFYNISESTNLSVNNPSDDDDAYLDYDDVAFLDENDYIFRGL